MPPADPSESSAGDAHNAAGDATPGLIRRRPVYDGRIVHLSVDTVRFPDGSTGEMEMMRHSGASAVLPIMDDGDDPEIVLVRQYRYAAGGELFEVPAGRPDREGEPWEDCARRELEEEIGLVAGRLTRLGEILTTPGFTDERIQLFLAFDCTPGTVNHDPDEFLRPVRLRFSDALARARRGEIIDAKTLCTLFLAEPRIPR